MIRPRDLISPEYLQTQVALHADKYGTRGDVWAPAVREMVASLQATSVLDYGCGGGALCRALRGYSLPGVRLDEYDPAIPGKDALPSFADLVVCTDVLEHIEPDRLDTVLRHLQMLARKAVFAVIATREAIRTLTDGRNAHLTVEPGEWWTARLTRAGFAVAPGPTKTAAERELSVILTPHSQVAA